MLTIKTMKVKIKTLSEFSNHLPVHWTEMMEELLGKEIDVEYSELYETWFVTEGQYGYALEEDDFSKEEQLKQEENESQN